MTETNPDSEKQDGAPPNDGSAKAAQAGEAPAAAQTPEQRIAALEAERNETRDRMLRIAAEFENYKKRVRREQQESETKAKESVLRDLLEVSDNMDRAAAFDDKADLKALQQGVSLVARLFQSKLERHEVRAFEAKGQPFDPRIHDAVSQVPSADAPPGSVLSEVQKGYRIGDRLLRPALVVVAVAPPKSEPSGDKNEAPGSGSSGG